MQSQVELGSDYIQSLRQETEKLYRLAKDDQTDQAILSVIQTCELTTLKALLRDYKAEAEKLHPAHSQQIKQTRQSSEASPLESPNNDDINIEDYKN